MDAYQQLRNLMLSKNLNEGTKKAVRVRLTLILEDELKKFNFWAEHVQHKLNATRRAEVERRFNKEIQAIKIVIHKLTPFLDRTDDEPSIIVKKKKNA